MIGVKPPQVLPLFFTLNVTQQQISPKLTPYLQEVLKHAKDTTRGKESCEKQKKRKEGETKAEYVILWCENILFAYHFSVNAIFLTLTLTLE